MKGLYIPETIKKHNRYQYTYGSQYVTQLDIRLYDYVYTEKNARKYQQCGLVSAQGTGNQLSTQNYLFAL